MVGLSQADYPHSSWLLLLPCKYLLFTASGIIIEALRALRTEMDSSSSSLLPTDFDFVARTSLNLIPKTFFILWDPPMRQKRQTRRVHILKQFECQTQFVSSLPLWYGTDAKSGVDNIHGRRQ
jgi:hypothetical protein